jgi:glutathione-regulated potassium-efflux system ancillary protein KefG
MPAVLLLHAHPAPHKSHANRRLLDAARKVEGVTVRELYEHYPDFLIDVPAEQQLLREHEVVVLQHPLYWYSAPALVKEWLDLVLQHGWAYGEGGHALRGKTFLQAVTCGGSMEVYCSAGRHGHTVRSFLLPFEQTARLCGMSYLAPFVVHGVGSLGTDDLLAPHVRDYTTALTALRDGTLDLQAAASPPWLNGSLASLVRSAPTTAS